MYVPKMDFETGEFKLSYAYKEILVLRDKLEAAGIPFLMRRNMDGWQICYPTFDAGSDTHCVCSCIQHCGSYGGSCDSLEIMGLLTPEEEERDSVVGYLSADDVFARIQFHYFTTELQQVRAELEAALQCVPHICDTCKYDCGEDCENCQRDCAEVSNRCLGCFGENWEWKGAAKEG